jgi:pimeloyl-ACP methyl ester carboxylesterase
VRRLCPLLVAAAALAPPPGASAALPDAPCPGETAVRCATVTVPLDRSGAVSGEVALAVRRVAADGPPATSAIVPLLGGPGQAAIPFTSELRSALSAGLGGHDFVVFDQRGTGESGALRCSAVLRSARPGGSRAADCAEELGAVRGSYTTDASVEDLEAIRQAGGYERLVLYGVSYGTKVALRYAAAHPDRVERLILDSVVTPDGPDPLGLSGMAAVSRVLRDLCAPARCSGITTDPVRDVGALRRKLSRHALRTGVVDGRGRHVGARLDAVDLLDVLNSGDLNLLQRADLPGSVRAALRGDGAPLARLVGRADGGGVSAPATQPGINRALYLATVCEDVAFPWRRSARPAQRIDEAQARLRALAPAAVAPFDRATALLGGLAPGCLNWPNAAPAPPPAGPLPAVSALLLAGQADLRTPAEDAAAVAASIPGAQLVVVPRAGHSVLGSDLSGCASAAVAAFLGGGTASPCATGTDSDPSAPTGVPPRSLQGLHHVGGVAGRAGRTLRGVLLTLSDATGALRSNLLAAGDPGTRLRLGGLRSGTLEADATRIRLSRYTYIRGVELTGTIPAGTAPVRVSVGGPAASHGALEITDTTLRGTLDGHRIALTARAAALRPRALALPFPRLARLP